MNVGDLVEPVSGMLRSGASAYDRAVVVQTDPLVLVSEETDMRWEHTIQNATFNVVGQVNDAVLDACMGRL